MLYHFISLSASDPGDSLCLVKNQTFDLVGLFELKWNTISNMAKTLSIEMKYAVLTILVFVTNQLIRNLTNQIRVKHEVLLHLGHLLLQRGHLGLDLALQSFDLVKVDRQLK